MSFRNAPDSFISSTTEGSSSRMIPLVQTSENGITQDSEKVAISAVQEVDSPSKLIDSFEEIEGDVNDGALSNDLSLHLQIEMLRGKLSRRNQVLEVIRRAYYRDVIIIKEELRQNEGKLSRMGSTKSFRAEIPRFQLPSSRQMSSESFDGGLSSVPSVDLRDTLPLFAPSETVLQVHPCESCGGHLELVHGESRELKAARQEMARATKGEQQMRAVVQKIRSDIKQMEEVNDALQQRVKALMKENAYTLEQLRAARKTEREQKVAIAGMRSKLQLTQATQDEIDRLSSEYRDVKQQLIRSNHDRDMFSASNNHLKEELGEVTKALHVVKVEKAQIESDFGANYYRLQEEVKKSRQLAAELVVRDEQVKEKVALNAEQQQSLTFLKEELASTLRRCDQTKRHLEDQLVEEERAREEMQEQNLELRRLNKKLARGMENTQNNSSESDISSMLEEMQEQNLELRRLNKKLMRDMENTHNNSSDSDLSSMLEEMQEQNLELRLLNKKLERDMANTHNNSSNSDLSSMLDDMQEQNLELRRLNKKLMRDIENIHNNSSGSDLSSMLDDVQEQNLELRRLNKKLMRDMANIHSNSLDSDLPSMLDEMQEQNLELRRFNKKLMQDMENIHSNSSESDLPSMLTGMQEQNLELRRLIKKLMRDIENIRNNSSESPSGIEVLDKHESDGLKKSLSPHPQGSTQAMAMRNIVYQKIEKLQLQLEWTSMRENDLAGILARNRSGIGRVLPLKRVVSRRPSKVVISRATDSEDEATRATPKAISSPKTSRNANEDVSGRINKESSLTKPDQLEVKADQVDKQNFETYHMEIARMLTEVKEGKATNAKQQKVVVELERKNQVLIDRLEESKLSIETLNGSVNALKMRLNHDSAGSAETIEAMTREIEEERRNLQYEAEKSTILMAFLRQVSASAHEVSENKALVLALELDSVPPDDPNEGAHGLEGGVRAIEIQRKKREVRRKVLKEKAMKKFAIMCHNRAEFIGVEMQKMRASFEQLRDDLDQAENKIDFDHLHIRTLEADISNLRLMVDVEKTNSGTMEQSLKQTTEELSEYLTRCKTQEEEITLLKEEHGKLQEDEKRLRDLLIEKTKAWQNEIGTNDKCSERIENLEAAINDETKERQLLQAKLNRIEEEVEFRRRTNRSVEVSAIPDTVESEVQTDRWKPQGLILRQRNAPDRMPQRFLGKASVMIHYPELSGALSTSAPHNQEISALSSLSGNLPPVVADADERMRGILELNVYPSIKAGGRQIKTSHSSSRPKALSRLFLSSDGISEKYIAPTPRKEGTRQFASFNGRPSTVL